ncbi:MAG TPA: glycosyl transferase, partial [Bacteroidales bacterium]|nr:glycosyl transferase [Bacteroidales bacterium]
GLESAQIKELPKGIIGIRKIDNVQKLAEYYSAADLFINPTWEDTFPTTNLESLACGTPVLTYDTGGSREAISKDTGFVTKKGDIQSVLGIIKKVKKIGKQSYSEVCRKRAISMFRQEDRFKEYISLYKELLETKHN